MKKFIIFILVLAVLIGTLAFFVYMDGDDADTASTEKTDVKVAVLNGTTGFGMAQLMEQNANKKASNNYKFSVETVGSDIIAQLVNGSVDIAALPTNAAAAVYNRTQGGVKVIAINTLGVLYAVENGETITSITDLEGKTIYCPAQNPQYILEYLLTKNNINATINTEYEAPADLRTALVSNQLGENAIAILPEPMVTMALNGNSSLRVALDLTAEWNAVEDSQLVQGCVVVRNEFYEKNKKAVSKFLDEYKASIEFMQKNVDEAAKLIVKHGIFANEAVAKAAIPKCNVTYLAGNDMKVAMEGFLTAMKEVAPASIGNKLPGDDFYLVTK